MYINKSDSSLKVRCSTKTGFTATTEIFQEIYAVCQQA